MKGPKPKPVAERFWAKVAKTKGCWLWTGHRNPAGYGTISVGSTRDGTATVMLAHRLSFILNRGPVAEGLHVCHHCDNPSCVRPDHLFLGTVQDNVSDMVRKNRQQKGERNGHAKLTRAEVIEMRRQRSSGRSLLQLAKGYHVSIGTVSQVCSGDTWAHVPLSSAAKVG